MFLRTVLLSFSASSSPRRVHCWTGYHWQWGTMFLKNVCNYLLVHMA